MKKVLNNRRILEELSVKAFERGKKFNVVETTKQIEDFLDTLV